MGAFLITLRGPIDLNSGGRELLNCADTRYYLTLTVKDGNCINGLGIDHFNIRNH